MKEKRVLMWVTPKFRKAIYSEKAVDPSKRITDICNRLADDMTINKEKEKKKKNYWGRI